MDNGSHDYRFSKSDFLLLSLLVSPVCSQALQVSEISCFCTGKSLPSYIYACRTCPSYSVVLRRNCTHPFRSSVRIPFCTVQTSFYLAGSSDFVILLIVPFLPL